MEAMTETYRAAGYNVLLVTGVYVRRLSKKRGYRVFETATCNRPGSQFHGRPGMGYTLREYDTTGEELPADFRERLRAEQTTLEWKP